MVQDTQRTEIRSSVSGPSSGSSGTPWPGSTAVRA